MTNVPLLILILQTPEGLLNGVIKFSSLLMQATVVNVLCTRHLESIIVQKATMT